MDEKDLGPQPSRALGVAGSEKPGPQFSGMGTSTHCKRGG